MKNFKEFGLKKEIITALDELGFDEPSPVQAKVIPFISESGQDLIALAQTGTGKTGAFALPVLNQIKPNKKTQVLILCPTRELCLQITKDIKNFSKYLKNISTLAVYGGDPIHLQIKNLKKGADIVVGTPGRLNDLTRRKVLDVENIKWLVLDEADEMLDMGFKDDLDAILEKTPSERQTLLISATMSRNVANVAKNYMKDAEEISLGEKNSACKQITHEYYLTSPRDKFEALRRILDFLPGVYGILFCRTKIETQEISDKLKRIGYSAEALHGDISQNMRTKIMAGFKNQNTKLLVATDVAARGIDVNDLSHVINYNLPDKAESYTHRSGRTGRAGKSGASISIIGRGELGKIKRLESVLGLNFELKKIPSLADVIEKQIKIFTKKIKESSQEKSDNDKYFSKAIDELKEISKEDLIKVFLKENFSDLLTGKIEKDLNIESKGFADRKNHNNDNSVSLKINLGKKDGFGVKELFGLVNSNKSLKGVDIGKITLMGDFSVFTIDKKSADRVLKALGQAKFRGKNIQINHSNQKFSSPKNKFRKKRNFSGRR